MPKFTIVTSGRASSSWAGAWTSDKSYDSGKEVGNSGDLFVCTESHTSSAATEPGVGVSWQSVWARKVDALPSVIERGVVAGKDCQWQGITTADVEVNSIEAAGQAAAGSVASGALAATSNDETKGTDVLPESTSTSDTEAYSGQGGAVGQTATTIFSRKGSEQIDISHDMLAAIAAATSPSATNPFRTHDEIPVISSGQLSERPAAGIAGRLFIGTDSLILYRDTGTVWTNIRPFSVYMTVAEAEANATTESLMIMVAQTNTLYALLGPTALTADHVAVLTVAGVPVAKWVAMYGPCGKNCLVGTTANRPVAENMPNGCYLSTTDNILYISDGSTWHTAIPGIAEANSPSSSNPLATVADLGLNMNPGGRLCVPHAFKNAIAGQVFAMTSASNKDLFAFTPEVDFALSSLSHLFGTVSNAGDMSVGLYLMDGTAIDPNGLMNPSTTSVVPTMSDNSTPSPCAVYAVDKNGNNILFHDQVYKLFNANTTDYPQLTGYTAKQVTSGGSAVDKGGGKVGIPVVGHGIPAGEKINLYGSANYVSNVYNVDATSTTDELVVIATYAAETFGSNVWVNVRPSSNYPVHLCIDLGAAKIVNRFRAMSQSFWKTGTWHASNVASPAKHTDADWTQLASWSNELEIGVSGIKDYSVTNSNAYRWYKWKITDIVSATGATCLLRELYLYGAQSIPAPSTLITNLGSVAVSASSWVRQTFTPVQLQRGKTYAIVRTGQASKSWNIQLGTNSGAVGGSMPDNCYSLKSTDGGTTWTRVYGDYSGGYSNYGRQYIPCIVLNSTTNHCPQLIYGQFTSECASVSGLSLIQRSGAILDCEGLAADTTYNVYLYKHTDGTLKLDASATGRVLSNGRQVKSGDPSRLFVGIMRAVNWNSSYQGPIDVEDYRGIDNEYNKITKTIGKRNIYSANTSESLDGKMAWINWSGGDFIVRLVTLGANFRYAITCTFSASSYMPVAIGLDGVTPIQWNLESFGAGNSARQPTIYESLVNLTEGFHTLHPLVMDDMINGYAGAVIQYYETGAGHWKAYALGTVNC